MKSSVSTVTIRDITFTVDLTLVRRYASSRDRFLELSLNVTISVSAYTPPVAGAILTEVGTKHHHADIGDKMTLDYTFLRVFAARDGGLARRIPGVYPATAVAGWAGRAAERHAHNDSTIIDTGLFYEDARIEALTKIEEAIDAGGSRFLVYRDDVTNYYAELANKE